MAGPRWCVPVHKHKLLYFQIPKCANTSILLSLGCVSDWENFPKIEQLDERDHHSVQQRIRKYKENFSPDLLDKYKDYYKFTFVRNPWDRSVSCWNDKVKNRKNSFKAFSHYGLGDRNITFAEYAKKIKSIPDSSANDHIRSQSYCVVQDGSCVLDWFGKVENMNGDWKELQTFLKENRGIDLPDIRKMNSVKRDKKKYLDYYDQETYDIITSRYKEDIDLFGYESDFQ